MGFEPKIILVDQDDVIAGYKHKFCEIWNNLHPDRKLNYSEIKSPYLEKIFTNRDDRAHVINILTTPGFFLSLDPLPGARDALEEMVKMDHKVSICTSPLLYFGGEKVRYLECESEKRRWILTHLGDAWHESMITTGDKTRQIADYLIDDNPKPKGLIKKPLWEHVLYNQPYNADIKGLRRIDWQNWKEILPELIPPGYKR